MRLLYIVYLLALTISVATPCSAATETNAPQTSQKISKSLNAKRKAQYQKIRKRVIYLITAAAGTAIAIVVYQYLPKDSNTETTTPRPIKPVPEDFTCTLCKTNEAGGTGEAETDFYVGHIATLNVHSDKTIQSTWQELLKGEVRRGDEEKPDDKEIRKVVNALIGNIFHHYGSEEAIKKTIEKSIDKDNKQIEEHSWGDPKKVDATCFNKYKKQIAQAAENLLKYRGHLPEKGKSLDFAMQHAMDELSNLAFLFDRVEMEEKLKKQAEEETKKAKQVIKDEQKADKDKCEELVNGLNRLYNTLKDNLQKENLTGELETLNKDFDRYLKFKEDPLELMGLKAWDGSTINKKVLQGYLDAIKKDVKDFTKEYMQAIEDSIKKFEEGENPESNLYNEIFNKIGGASKKAIEVNELIRRIKADQRILAIINEFGNTRKKLKEDLEKADFNKLDKQLEVEAITTIKDQIKKVKYTNKDTEGFSDWKRLSDLRSANNYVEQAEEILKQLKEAHTKWKKNKGNPLKEELAGIENFVIEDEIKRFRANLKAAEGLYDNREKEQEK